MSEKILDSKIQIPIRFKNFIARDELLDILKSSYEKVVVLNAGAGFGKTMLLTYYTVKSEEKCAWYHLNSLDNDIMNFIKYLSYSLNKVKSDFQYNYDNQENKSGNELIESIATDFAIYISQFSEYKISILLDDFQEINNEEIFNFLSIVLNNTNENLRFFIATKGSFPKFLARYLLQGSVAVLNDKKLVFNRNEVMSILRETQTITDIASCADFILEYTEGWPAGVIAITLSLRNERKTYDKEEIITLCKESKVYDYFMYEIFKKLPFDIQTFLMHTSVLNILSADLCNAVMNTTAAKSTLDYLVQENIFVVMLSGKGNVYRYHSIFKDYLNMQVSEKVKLEVMKKAATYCLNKGDYEQAVEYAIECNDVTLMQRAFELIGIMMITLGEMLTLNRWIDYLNNTKADLSAKTKLVLSCYYYNKKDFIKAFELIEGACEGFENENNENDYVEGMLQKAEYLQEQGDLPLCNKELTKALTFVKRKYSVNWYVLSAKKMEVHLLLINEIEAFNIAEEIINGSTLYIRGGKEIIVNNIKESAKVISDIGKLHLKGDYIETKEYPTQSLIIYEYCMWCKIQSLYLNHEEDAAYNYITQYLERIQTNNTFAALIRIIGCIILLHQGNLEKSTQLLFNADVFLDKSYMELAKIRKEDIKILNGTFQFSENRKEYNKITVKCFENGIAYIDKQDQEIKWRTKKAYEMFAYLFDRQGKAVSKDTIIGLLWPDMPLDKAVTLFHTTLSYMRKTLTEQNLGEIIQNKNNGYSLDMYSIETDYTTLMDIYSKVQMEQFNEIDDADKLVELYKLSYFENITSEWVISKREHLERVFILCCKEMAEDMIRRQKYKESSIILSRVVKLDPYSEELLMMIMKAFGAIGDIKSVKNYYDEAKKTLREELDTELSDDIEDLYNEIIHRKK